MLQPWILKLIRNAEAFAATRPTLLSCMCMPTSEPWFFHFLELGTMVHFWAQASKTLFFPL